MEILAVAADDIQTQRDALELVRSVFLEFEAPDYDEEGVQEFMEYIRPENIRENLATGRQFMWQARLDGETAGVLAGTPDGHVNLLFVAKQHHRKGSARALMEIYAQTMGKAGATQLTVNSSPYAVEAYKKMGFAAAGGEQTVNGIRFVPMARPL